LTERTEILADAAFTDEAGQLAAALRAATGLPLRSGTTRAGITLKKNEPRWSS
jgi:hypothetical protein